MGRILLIGFLLFSGFSKAQVENITAIVGFGGGLPLKTSVAPQDYAVDIFTEIDAYTTQLRLGLRYDLDDKNKLEIFYKRTRFRLSNNKIINTYKSRFPDQHFYPAFTIGNYSSNSFNSFRYSIDCLELHYGQLYEKSNVSFFPYVGLGIGLYSHDRFYYFLRDKNSNYATEYQVNIKTNVRPTFSLGFRAGLNKIPGGQLDLSIHGGINKYSFEVFSVPQNPAVSTGSSLASFRKFISGINLVLVLPLVG